MITIASSDGKKLVINEGKPTWEADLALEGLSTDTKPTGTYSGLLIRNGSTYYEMDTVKIYKYDAENEEWLEQ